VPGRVGCASAVGIGGRQSGAPKGAARFQLGPVAAGPGKAAPGLEPEASLEVPIVQRFTPYLSAIRAGPRRPAGSPLGGPHDSSRGRALPDTGCAVYAARHFSWQHRPPVFMVSDTCLDSALNRITLKAAVDCPLLLQVPGIIGNPTAPQFTSSVRSASFTMRYSCRLALSLHLLNCRF
jgi:hypothetical protein